MVRRATLALPVYEEALVIRETLTQLFQHITTELGRYEWEVVVVDDGSHDRSLEEIVTASRDLFLPMRLLAHDHNYGLGGALSTIFREARGDIIVTVDADLTYSADNVAPLVAALEASQAAVAVASPYMPGGVTRGVPAALEMRSRLANRFLSMMSGGRMSTFTGIVRAYDGEFARSLPPLLGAARANVDVLHEAWRQGLLVVEIPAELNWSGQQSRRGRHRMLCTSDLLESAFVIWQGVRLGRVSRRLGPTGGRAAIGPIAGTQPTSDPFDVAEPVRLTPILLPGPTQRGEARLS